MSARVDNLPPGVLGEVGAGWTVELDAMPHSASQSSPSTGVVTFDAVADFDAHLAMNNSATFTYDDLDYSEVPEVLIGDSLIIGGYGRGTYNSGTYNGVLSGSSTGAVQVWEPPGSLAITGAITGTIDSASLVGVKGSFTQGTGFSQFVTRDIYVPPVTSGSPLAAFNLAWQLAGNQPCSLKEPNSIYWALRGHDAGFTTAKNQYIAPADLTTYRLASDGKTPFRKWNVKNSFSSTGWAVADGELWSTGGVGSSVLHQANRRTVLVATTNLHGRSTVIQFGSSTTDDNLGFGPDDLKGSSGKWFSLALHGPTASATLTGQYRAGGGYVTVNKTASLSGIDMTQPVQLVIDVGYPTSKSFTLTMYVQNVDNTDLSPVTITTGLLNTAVDVYAAPWKCTGYIHGLYMATHAYTSGYDPTVLLGTYEDWSAQPLCDADNYGIGAPILAFNGGLWDYLTQVCLARQVGLRQSSGRFTMSAMSDDSIQAQVWHPAATPTFAIDNSSVASTVEIDAQFATFGKAPRIYDALTQSDDYSVAPGTVGSFSINSTSINGLVYNPEPLADLNDFLTNSHPYGAYIVSGPDNLPIPVAEWIKYGGSVAVAQTGLNTLTVTVVCPAIPIETTGDFFLGVSDASTAHPLLRLSSPAGGAVTDHTTIFETGASFAGASSTGSSMSNIAATDSKSLQNAAAWAVVDAAGPNLTLNGSFPLEDLRQWASGDFGMVPGATILYRNVQWRILTATVSDVSVAFTAAPYTTYRCPYFDTNWAGYTVDDFATFWDGKTYDDMATMVLAGPNYDWDSEGAVARYSLYPAGGVVDTDPGLDPSTTLLPSETLDPDAPGLNFGGHGPVGIFPQGSNLFPGSEEDPI